MPKFSLSISLLNHDKLGGVYGSFQKPVCLNSLAVDCTMLHYWHGKVIAGGTITGGGDHWWGTDKFLIPGWFVCSCLIPLFRVHSAHAREMVTKGGEISRIIGRKR